MAARAQTLILLLAACCLPAASRTHVYDAFNRIESVTESGAASWSRSFTYDRYGNRAATGFQVTVATPPATTSTYYTAATNRLTTDWALYDDDGNMTAFKNPNGTSDGQWSAAYDGENKQRYYCDGTIAACGAANKTGEYVYDGEGNRVLKMVTGGAKTTYVYDAFGRLAAEYTVGGPSETAGTFYRTTDHLGSTRLVTDSSGDVVSRRDFFPFGEEIDADATSGRIISGSGYNEDMGFPQLFTAKERDEESGLDYFVARYMSSALGRFTSADAPFLDQVPIEPQSWNLYAYVRNNPLVFVDPTGQRCENGISVDTGVEGQDGNACFETTVTETTPPPADVPVNYLAQGVFDQLGQSSRAVQPLLNVMAFGLSLFSGSATATVTPEIVGLGLADEAAQTGGVIMEALFHYTDDVTAELIQSSQLGVKGKDLFLTTEGGLSPLQAQIELALPAKNAATAVFRVEPGAVSTANVVRAGRVLGNVNERAGGGFEIVHQGTIALDKLTRIK